jgi:hypothetical protein
LYGGEKRKREGDRQREREREGEREGELPGKKDCRSFIQALELAGDGEMAQFYLKKKNSKLLGRNINVKLSVLSSLSSLACCACHVCRVAMYSVETGCIDSRV